MKTNKKQERKLVSANLDRQKQAWRTAAQNFSELNTDLIDAVESKRISKARFKLIKSPFSELGISRVGFFVMMCLSSDSSIRSSELAKRWGVSKGALTGVINTLKIAGYVIKCKDLNDGRAHVIILTNEGKQFLQRSLDKYSNWLSEAFSKLNEGKH